MWPAATGHHDAVRPVRRAGAQTFQGRVCVSLGHVPPDHRGPRVGATPCGRVWGVRRGGWGGRSPALRAWGGRWAAAGGSAARLRAGCAQGARRGAQPLPRRAEQDFKAYVHNGAPKGALLLVWSVLLLVTGTASLSSCRSWSESQYQVGLADTAVACVARWRSPGPSVCGGSRADGFGLCQPALPRSLGPVRKHCFFQFGLNRGSPRLRLDPRYINFQYIS